MGNEKATYFIDLDDRGYFSTLNKADSRLNKFERNVNRVNGVGGGNAKRGLGGMSAMFGMAARAAGALGLAMGAARLGGTIVRLGVDMEQTRVAFGTMFGTMERGNAVIAEMNEFSNVTPFDNAKVIQSAKTLAAFGVEADQLKPTLQLLGDVSAGTGKDLSEMAVIFGQIKSAGRLMGQDLLQLINAGFNPLQEISAKTGRSVMDLKKDMEKGLISFEMVEQTFKDVTSEGGKFFNLMEKQSKTVGGRWSTLVGKLQMLGIKIGESLLPALGQGVDLMLEMVELIPKLNFQPLTSSIKDHYSAIGDLLSLFGDLAESLGFATKGVSGFQNAVNLLSGTFRVMSTPMRYILGLLTALGEMMPGIAEQFSGLGDVISGAWNWDGDRIGEGWEKIMSGGGKADKAVMDRFKKIIDQDKEFWGSLGLSKAQLEGREAFDKNYDKAGGLGGGSGGGSGAGGSAGSAAGGAASKSVSSSIAGSAPKNVTLNIQKLVENINFNQQNFQQNKQQMVDEIKKALLYSLNDTVIAAG